MTQLELSLDELTRLRECELVIEVGLQTFIEVGNALLEIRDARLYRQSFKTFEDYCRGRWEMSLAQGKRLIAAAEVVQILAPIGAIRPTHESQVRPLTNLEPEQQRDAWEVATSIDPNPTADLVSKVARTITKAVEDAYHDSRTEVSSARVANPDKPNPPFDDRWLQWIGGIKQICRIDPFNVDAILEQQSRVGDEEAVHRRFKEAETAKERIQEFLTKIQKRYPNVFV